MGAKERSQHDEEGSNGLLCYRVNAEAEMEKLKCEEGMKDEKRGGDSHSIMSCLLNSNSSSCTYCRSEAVGWVLPMSQSLESFGLNPILINPPGAAFQICETSRNQGLKRNQATVSCWSSQQSYLVWACHLSGQWMHEIREGEEEENVSTTEGEGDKGGRDWGKGVGGWGGVTWQGEESN